MQTTLDLLDSVKEKTGIESDYALSKVLGATRASISCYRNGKERMGDATCMRIAEILSLPPAYVFAIAHAERAREEGIKEAWYELAKKLHHAAPILAGVVVLTGALPLGKAAMCILCKIGGAFTQALRKPATRFLSPA